MRAAVAAVIIDCDAWTMVDSNTKQGGYYIYKNPPFKFESTTTETASTGTPCSALCLLDTTMVLECYTKI